MSDSSAQMMLTLKAERPVASCELVPSAFLYLKGGAMDNAARQKMMDANPHRFEFEWQRGPRRKACASAVCPRGDSFDPTKWSRASMAGGAVQCAVCYRLGKRSPTETTFCCEVCFFSAWREHSVVHAGLFARKASGGQPLARTGSLTDVMTDEFADVSAAVNGENGVGGTPAHGRTSSNLSESGQQGYGDDEYHTICSDSAYTPTLDDVGCVLRIVVTALSVSDGSRLAGPVIIRTPPVLSPPRCTPLKVMLQQQRPPTVSISSSPIRFRVVSYNILAELYATRQAYPYCDSWSLSWPFRKRMILQEIEAAAGDVVCLQEVQMDHFDQHLNPSLTEMGFDGIFKAKSRDSMGQYGKVDGCATFWRRTKFVMVENYSIEFNELARRGAMELGLDEAEGRKYLNRLSRDNIAQIVVLEVLTPSGKANRQQVCIANTHLYSNPQRPDVKLWQCLSLVRELEQFLTQRDLALLLCGDFNSEPDSAVYEFLSDGQLNRPHPELEQQGQQHPVHVLPDLQDIYHSLNLSSSMGSVMGAEPLFTNYTANFKGTLDYIFYSNQRLYVTAANNLPSAQELQFSSGEGLPSACYPSDHLLLCCDVAIASSVGVRPSR